MDPVLEHISGGDPSVIDKMRFISKKELAKHRALARDRDFKRFEDIDLKNENEISLKDIASDDEYKFSSEEQTPISKYGEEEDDEGVENLYQFWEEQDKKKLAFLKERNPNIDVRLEEYLMSHSQQLSLHVQEYLRKIERGQDVPVNERISNLGIMAFERKQFVHSLRKVRNAFEYQMKQVFTQSKSQAKTFALNAFSKMEDALHVEINNLMGKYNELKDQTRWLINENQRITQIMQTQEI